jgi:hypothetical protein
MIKKLYQFGMYSLFVLVTMLFGTVGTAMAKECIDCHAGINAKGTDIAGQMRSQSHHVQGAKLTGRHCYACHWEATSDGKIDKRYHDGRHSKGKINLVIWADGVRPTKYEQNITAVTFSSAAIGTKSEREEVTKVSKHCISCHNDGNNDTKSFDGDNNTPRQYAWDRQSVASRYSQKGVTIWGKYSTAFTNKKNRITKAFSAHGNAAANQGGWSSTEGYDGDMPLTRGGINAKNVECFDCHNSHGSKVSGSTSSYKTFDGTFNGGILKETTSGKGGYKTTYKPSTNFDAKSKNPYNAGAGLCFDCHESEKAGSTPWGFKSTFGSTQPIMGYKDTLRFDSGVKGSTSRFTNRHSRSDVASSHLKSGSLLNYSTDGTINGLCTPCHDPHGVSQALGDKMRYAVPMLKGTWLTSPYREDGPPAGVNAKDGVVTARKTDYNNTNRDNGANFGKGESSAPRSGDFNTTNRSAGANFGKGDSSAPRSSDYNNTNRDNGANFGKGESSAPRTGDFNTTNRSAGANFGKGDSSAPRSSDYNSTNRDNGANFGKGESSAPRTGDYNTTNRSAGANFGKGDSSAPRGSDYNNTNRDNGANFGKGESSAPRSGDFNTTNRSAGANFGKGDSSAPRGSDYNNTNRDNGANFGKGESSAPRSGDFNTTNRSAGANFGKGDSSAPRSSDYNNTNRYNGANFGKGDSSAPRSGDFNTTNRTAGANFGKGDSASPRKNSDFNAPIREENSNFGKMVGGAPREPMKGMKYSVDRNTFGGDNRITENDETFAGLCMKCHTKGNFAGNSQTALIHRAVKGWGENKEHSFPCSKCHQSHNSGLPRLMQTNCFLEGPSGLRENSGLAWIPYKNIKDEGAAQSAAKSADSSKNKIVGCHVKQFGKSGTTAPKKQDGQWKELTPW